jgi:hypothetical protein
VPRLPPGHEAVCNAHPERLLTVHTSTCEDQVHGVTVADEPGKPDGTEVQQRYSESTTEDSEDGILCGDAHVAPQGELEAPGNRVSLDRRDYRLPKQHASRPERSRPVFDKSPTLPRRNGLEIRSCAERSVCAGEHCHARAVVILEFFERAKKHLGCCNVYGIAYLRPIDGDDEDIPVTLDQDTFHADPV